MSGTIYIPADRRAEQLGAALGQGVGAWNRQRVLGNAQNITDPTEQLNYLQTQLGPEGAEFIKNLSDLKSSQARIAESQASIEHSKAATAASETANKLNEWNLAHADQEFKLKQTVELSRVAQAKAAAAGDYARASQAGAETSLAQERLKELKQTNDLVNQLMTNMSKSVTGNDQTPQATPQSYSPESGGSLRAQPIGTNSSSNGGPKEISDSGPTQGTSKDFSAKLQMIQAADQGKDPSQAPTNRPQMTEGLRDEFLGSLAKRDIAGAGRALQKVGEPTQIFDNEIAPGITVKLGLYSDGQTRPIPGTVQDKRKPATPQLAQVATGASQWFNTSQTLKELGTNLDNPKGDILGSAAVRRLDAWLQGHGLQPTGAANVRSIKEAYTSIYQHNIIGITSLLAVARQTQALRQQLQDTAAKPTDAKELRDQKIAATEMTAQVFIKNEVETAIESGIHIPPPLMEIYKQLELDKQDLKTLRQNYMATISALGVKNPVDPLTGEVSTSSPKGGSGATIEIDGQAFPRADVEQRAKAKGMSVDEWINAVKSPAIPAKP